ncbi:MAG: hypothetical protein ACLS3V_04250 [Streptococcus sp.]
MIDRIKNVYRGRLQKNNWLTEGTRNKAIEKLDKMKVFVGLSGRCRSGTKGTILTQTSPSLNCQKTLPSSENVIPLIILMSLLIRINGLDLFDINAYYNPEKQ